MGRGVEKHTQTQHTDTLKHSHNNSTSTHMFAAQQTTHYFNALCPGKYDHSYKTSAKSADAPPACHARELCSMCYTQRLVVVVVNLGGLYNEKIG